MSEQAVSSLLLVTNGAQPGLQARVVSRSDGLSRILNKRGAARHVSRSALVLPTSTAPSLGGGNIGYRLSLPRTSRSVQGNAAANNRVVGAVPNVFAFAQITNPLKRALGQYQADPHHSGRIVRQRSGALRQRLRHNSGSLVVHEVLDFGGTV